MKKKYSFIVPVVLITLFGVPLSYAVDISSHEANVLSHGLYVGGMLGYEYATINDNFVFNVVTSHGPSDLTGYDDISATGFVGGGLIGYGQALPHHLYLGLELFANAGTTSVTNQTIYNHNHEVLYDSDGYQNHIAINNNVGISILPGIQVNQSTLVYGQLGYRHASISGSESIIFYSEPQGLPQSKTPFNLSFSPDGFSYGLGIETALVNQLSVRGELIHTDYHHFTSRLNNKLSVSDNQATLSLIYHFNALN